MLVISCYPPLKICAPYFGSALKQIIPFNPALPPRFICGIWRCDGYTYEWVVRVSLREYLNGGLQGGLKGVKRPPAVPTPSGGRFFIVFGIFNDLMTLIYLNDRRRSVAFISVI